jgi:hypothetical protein
MIRSLLAAAAFLAGSVGLAAELPSDLANVPPNAAGFVHIRVGDIYKSDHLKDLRAAIEKAGPEALKTFSARFAPDPTTLDRVTIYAVLPSGEGPPRPIPSIIFRMSKPFDGVQLQKSLGPKGAAKRVGEMTFLVDRENDMAVRIIDDRTFQIGPPEGMERLITMRREADGPLAPALAKAVTKPLMAAFNAAAVPPELRAQIPAPAVPIAKLKLATLSAEFTVGAKIDLRLIYPDADSAGDADQMIHTLVEMGRSALVGARAELERILEGQGKPSTLMQLPEATGALVGLGALRQYEELLKSLPLKREGAEISITIDVPPGMYSNLVATSAIGAGLLLPAVQKVREAASRSQSQNNLKQLAISMHNYNDVYGGKLPAHAIYSKDGRTPLLSWRVAILPYMEQDHLYKQFHLDEPWDSEHNKKLIPLMLLSITPGIVSLLPGGPD